MGETASSEIVFSKPSGKPRTAFSDRSWLDPKAEGPLGKVKNGLSAESVCAHAGVAREGKLNHAVTPVYTGTTVPTATCEELAGRFADPCVHGRRGGIYSRLGHVPGFELERALAALHGCNDAMVFASGMAAISHTILPLVTAGDNVTVHKNVYGCSDNLFGTEFPELGVETRFVDLRNPEVIDEALDDRTRAVFFETPSNPVLDVIDIAAVVKKVGGRCPVIVDNTFASPMGQNPFDQGAHVVIYSLTKSIGGHTNAIGGAVLGSGVFLTHLFLARKDYGGMLAPREAAAFLNGIKTLPVRYKKMENNAKQVAEMLRGNPEVEKVFYPLFEEGYPFNGQMKGPGYIIAFTLKKGLKGGKALINNLKLLVHAVSLGSVETLICHPASTTHSCIDKKSREAKGISDGLIRLSVGIESAAEIKADLEQALHAVSKA